MISRRRKFEPWHTFVTVFALYFAWSILHIVWEAVRQTLQSSLPSKVAAGVIIILLAAAIAYLLRELFVQLRRLFHRDR